MHLGEDFDVFHHILAIGLQSAVHIVQLYACHTARSSVEQFAGEVLGQFVVIAFLLPTTNQVIALFLYHAIQLGNLIGRVLQVSIHGNDHIALYGLKATVQRSRLTIIATKTNAVNVLILLAKRLYDLP